MRPKLSAPLGRSCRGFRGASASQGNAEHVQPLASAFGASATKISRPRAPFAGVALYPGNTRIDKLYLR